ncbi:aminoglycoside adenylyltransferase domain-containing protein [Cupriavidus gilardii]|uniref:aminoglycoside adenylyltransferase domain-containing protein n=1 Tax=Cupriavidus gilardii TaxID=82541 RepID=UPI0006B2DB1A|nr:aminoglycoside adenylyltransferase domain-containing protein [Cupriavidus gilardii]WNG71097.1 DUF4111 domain-containing protein [Cupriavidus gilardii]
MDARVTLATRKIVAKDAAADWLLPRLPQAQRALLATARDAYRGEGGDGADEAWHERGAHVRAWVDDVSQAIARMLREGGAA